jgi:hypothetical protein
MADGDRLIPMDAEAIREWRRNIPEGHSRHAYEFKSPGRGGVNRDNPVHDPDQSPELMDPERGMDLDPLPEGRATPLEARDELERRVLAWVRSVKTPAQKRMLREIVQQRVELLKATSPIQFSHIDSASLEDQLIATLKAKAQEGVERVYTRRGWVKPHDFDLVGSAAPATAEKVLLPGQKGRVS